MTENIDSQNTRKNLGWVFVLGILISTVFLFLALRSIDWSGFINAFHQVDPVFMGLSFLGSILPFMIVSLRWKLLLSDTVSVSFNEIFDYTMIGYFAGMIFPARLGDFGKAVLVGRSKKVSSSQVFGTVILERLMDTVMLLILAIGLSFLMDYSLPIRNALIFLSTLAVVIIACTVLVAWNIGKLENARVWLSKRLPIKAIDYIFGLIERLAAGLRAIRHRKVLIYALFLTMVSWIILGLTFIGYLRAFQITVPWYSAYFIILLINLSGIIPASPGNIGVYEYMVILALTFWSIEKSPCLSFGVLTHGANIVLTTILGSWSLYRQGLSLRNNNII
jgi:glycosyltransferase 2 family protein